MKLDRQEDKGALERSLGGMGYKHDKNTLYSIPKKNKNVF